jgi:hypothetical protein
VDTYPARLPNPITIAKTTALFTSPPAFPAAQVKSIEEEEYTPDAAMIVAT